MIRSTKKAALTACLIIAAAGISSATTYLLSRSSDPARHGVVEVAFGKPTKMARLKYTVMYDKKPFPDAVLLYYDNGVYAILSKGENHYGTYVIDGGFDNPSYTAHYISLPSVDWNGKSVYHRLRFDTKAGTFAQQLTNPDDANVPLQKGTFTVANNSIVDPTQLTWDTAQSLGQ
ncbi:MAG TPA: hypothetical protein VFP72_16675 [Kineosporiaceae bacterium]|nr:hypothetical protein [Kineosporiaceae bacterium]